MVGGYNDNGGAGAAWVFTFSGGVWTQQGSKLVGTGAVGHAAQGFRVALSGDGSTAMVGGYNDDGGVGAAWVFTQSAGSWTQQGNKLVGTGAAGNADQGTSVALSADGNTALVGGPCDHTDPGYSCDPGYNGPASFTQGVGAAWAYTRSGGAWTQLGSKLVGTDAIGYAMEGFSVALSGDGSTAVLGGGWDNVGCCYASVGATWVFVSSPPPGRVTVFSPAQGATAVSLTPALIWGSVAGVTSYNVYFGTSSVPPFVANTVGTSYSPATLNANTTYYWYLVSLNAAGSTPSAIWSFTTGCPVGQGGTANVSTVHLMINEALGVAAPANDLNQDGTVNVTDIQLTVDAVLGWGCPSGLN
jgi:hypothetical protein